MTCRGPAISALYTSATVMHDMHVWLMVLEAVTWRGSGLPSQPKTGARRPLLPLSPPNPCCQYICHGLAHSLRILSSVQKLRYLTGMESEC